MVSDTLQALEDAKNKLALAITSTVKVVDGKPAQEDNYPLIAQRTKYVADCLEAHLITDPNYVWGAGKALAATFHEDTPYVGSGHQYFPAIEWEWHQNDAKDMLVWLQERVAWLES